MTLVESIKDSTNETPIVHSHYRVYSYRFVVAFFYFLLTLINTIQAQGFISIQTNLESIYGNSGTIINLVTTLSNYVVNLPTTFYGNYLIDKFGVQVGVYIGSILMVLGFWVRCLSQQGLGWILVGQCLGSIAAVFFSAPQKVSVNWFGVHERVLWTTVMFQAFNLGGGYGSEIAAYFVTDSDPVNGMAQVFDLCLWSAIVATVLIIISCIFLKDKPAVAPSPAAEAKKDPFWPSVKAMFKSKNNFIAVMGAGLFFSASITFVSTYELVVSPFGVQGAQIGTAFIIAGVPGFIGAVTIGRFASKTGKYKLYLVAAGLLTAGTLVFVFIASYLASTWLMSVSISMFAIFLQPMVPMLLEYVCEIAYPSGEAVIGGMIFIIGNIGGVLESLVVDTVLTDSPTTTQATVAFGLIIVWVLLAVLLLAIAKEDLKRTSKEEGIIQEEESHYRDDAQSEGGESRVGRAIMNQ